MLFSNGLATSILNKFLFFKYINRNKHCNYTTREVSGTTIAIPVFLIVHRKMLYRMCPGQAVNLTRNPRCLVPSNLGSNFTDLKVMKVWVNITHQKLNSRPAEQQPDALTTAPLSFDFLLIKEIKLSTNYSWTEPRIEDTSWRQLFKNSYFDALFSSDLGTLDLNFFLFFSFLNKKKNVYKLSVNKKKGKIFSKLRLMKLKGFYFVQEVCYNRFP